MFIFQNIVQQNVAFVSAFGHLTALDSLDHGTALLFPVGAFGIFALTYSLVYLGETKRKIFKIKEIKSLKIKH